MTLNEEFKQKREALETIFKEEINDLHFKIIDGSPVDKGRFKTSWQLLDFNVKNLTFHLVNPIVYGVGLWRYGRSKQGWSLTGGDRLVEEAERKMSERIRDIR